MLAKADIELFDGNYYETTTDLAVKIQGGVLKINRTWYLGKWYINRKWNVFNFTYDNLDGKIQNIEQNGIIFEILDSHFLIDNPSTKLSEILDSHFLIDNPSTKWQNPFTKLSEDWKQTWQLLVVILSIWTLLLTTM